MTRLMALLELSPEVFCRLLQLPDGAVITGVIAPPERHGVLRIRIEGAGWPTNEGDMLRSTTATITDTHDAAGAIKTHRIEWPFPD